MPVKLSSDKREAVERTASDLDLIRDLARILDETGLTEIEIGSGAGRIRVARQALAQPVAAAAALGPAPALTLIPGAAAEKGAILQSEPANHPGAVTSPMVGAAYVAPEPSAPPFVKVGDQVSEGQTLLIIEAMKTMNPIRAPRAGRVSRILVENGAPVEYGEVLLIIE
jgi:acetyl-CoA carboxylase biotin carboxyl carrier protein